MPKDNTSSVVVLEGDYTNLDTDKIFSLESIEMKENNIFDEPEICEASVEYSSNNEFTNISNAPYIAYLNVEGLRFDDNYLKSLILSIEPDNYYGYQEYNARITDVDIGYYVKVDDSEGYGVILTQPGDVNLDGEINIQDKALLNDYRLGRVTLNAQQIFNADINEDGVINSLDGNILSNIHTGRIPAPDPVYIKKNVISNLQIFSYIPIPEGTKFIIKYINPILDDDSLYIYPTESVLTNNKLLDELLLSKLSLLQFNDEKNYPFADTLIEYLTLNAIDSAETISDNIKRVQNYFGGLNRIDSTYGAWSNYLRAKIYLDTIYNKQITHLDNIGYVDKIVESTMVEQKIENDLPISTSYEYDNYVALKQQELRKNSRKMSTINQPVITSKNNVVNNSLLVNPSSLTPVQKLIGDNIPYKKPRDEEGMVPPGVNDD